jgi:hypothetical protein
MQNTAVIRYYAVLMRNCRSLGLYLYARRHRYTVVYDHMHAANTVH